MADTDKKGHSMNYEPCVTSGVDGSGCNPWYQADTKEESVTRNNESLTGGNGMGVHGYWVTKVCSPR